MHTMLSPQSSDDEVSRREFDFVIIGGGTAGLAVAARLSEDPSLQIIVLEAGPDVQENEHVDTPGWYGSTLGTSLDWKFETIPQSGLNGRTIPWARGKAVGGTSLLNFMAWNRASRQDYDAWEGLGCTGWGWDGILSVNPRHLLHLSCLTTESDYLLMF